MKIRKLSRREIKQLAQDDLLHFASNAFCRIPDDPENDPEIPLAQAEEFRHQLSLQYTRIQKLFGIAMADLKLQE